MRIVFAMDKAIKVLVIVAIVIILAIPVTIIASGLFAFGIFAPTAVGPCTGLSKLLYMDHGVSYMDSDMSNGKLILVVANGTGGPLQGTTTATITGSGISGGTGMTCTPDNALSSATITCQTAAGVTVTPPYDATIEITYTPTAGTAQTETATCKG